MQTRTRTKWEPALLMALVLGLGLWIAFGPASTPKFPTGPDAVTQQFRLGNRRGVLEAFKPAGAADHSFRVWIKDGPAAAKVLSRAEAEQLFGKATIDETTNTQQSWLLRRVFKLLNITTAASLVWVGIGFFGQLAFSGRMILQWLISEKEERSVITESFWWFSLFGGIALFSYFVWRHDPVGILGQASGIVIYFRNIRLLRKQARRSARDDAEPR